MLSGKGAATIKIFCQSLECRWRHVRIEVAPGEFCDFASFGRSPTMWLDPMPTRRARSFLVYVPKPEARAALWSLGLSVVLVAVKFTAYLMTGSAAIFSDALENVVNVLAAGFAVYALAVAHTPADREHPYGHGKIEFLSAGFEGGMILLAALVVIYKTVGEIITHSISIEKIGWGVGLTTLAMLANGLTGVSLIHFGKRRESATLEADGYHLFSDAATSAGALVALVIVHWTHFAYADPIAAILLAFYMAYLGAMLLRHAGSELMDRQDEAEHQRIARILESHVGPNGVQPRICGYHKLRHRHSGRFHWVDFHVVLPVDVGLEAAHNIASALEHEIEITLQEGNATAHVEPLSDPSDVTCQSLNIEIPPPPPHLRK